MRAVLRRRNLLICLFAVAGAVSRAQSSAPPPVACPWVTHGSAARALAAEVSVTAQVSDAGEGWCKFSRTQQPDAFLKVEVSKTALPSCGAGSIRLKGVGNEAMRCTLPGSGDLGGEMITGRVRDLHFVITFEPRAKKSPASPADTQEDILQLVAEQVAGNLF